MIHRLMFLMISFLSAISQLSLHTAYQKGVNAYKAGDHQTYLRWMRVSDSLRPNHPKVMYKLASALALNQHKAESVRYLGRSLRLNASMNYATDSDFINLKSYAPFFQLEAEIRVLRTPTRNSRVVFQGQDSLFHPEDVAVRKSDGRLFVSSVRLGIIQPFDATGNPLRPLTHSSFASLMGIDLSGDGRLLWVCSTPTSYRTVTDSIAVKPHLSLVDLSSGAILARYEAPDRSAWLGDVIRGANGQRFVTNGSTNSSCIYRVDDQQDTLVVWARHPDWLSLQGMVVDVNRNTAFVADYRRGIYRIDLSTKEILRISIPETIPVKGIDGMYLFEGDLIVLQNGVRPQRIARLRLNSAGTGVVSGDILETTGNTHTELTLGEIVDGTLIYVSNSSWPAYDRSNQPDLKKFEPVIIRSLPLNLAHSD